MSSSGCREEIDGEGSSECKGEVFEPTRVEVAGVSFGDGDVVAGYGALEGKAGRGDGEAIGGGVVPPDFDAAGVGRAWGGEVAGSLRRDIEDGVEGNAGAGKGGVVERLLEELIAAGGWGGLCAGARHCKREKENDAVDHGAIVHRKGGTVDAGLVCDADTKG